MSEKSRRRDRRVLLLALIGTVTCALGGGAMSLALFTDSDDVTGNTFSTGTVVLTTSPTSALLSMSAMMPGDTVGPTALTVSNGGTAGLRYSMTSSSTDDGKALASQLTLDVKTKTANPCSTFDGTSLYSGALEDAAFGDTTAGDDSGDRTLAAAASEVLCFRVTLDDETDDTFQGATTTTTFTFVSEQTANNP